MNGVVCKTIYAGGGTLAVLQFTKMSKILNCDDVECPKDFEYLESCGERAIRTCMQCFKRVLLVSTKDTADAIISQGDRVAIQE